MNQYVKKVNPFDVLFGPGVFGPGAEPFSSIMKAPRDLHERIRVFAWLLQQRFELERKVSLKAAAGYLICRGDALSAGETLQDYTLDPDDVVSINFTIPEHIWEGDRSTLGLKFRIDKAGSSYQHRLPTLIGFALAHLYCDQSLIVPIDPPAGAPRSRSLQ